jgi:hypothetical protein
MAPVKNSIRLSFFIKNNFGKHIHILLKNQSPKDERKFPWMGIYED